MTRCDANTKQQKARYWQRVEHRRTSQYCHIARLTAQQFKAQLADMMEAMDGALAGRETGS